MSHIVSGTVISVKNITMCPHPPYSLNLAPCDFWLLPKVKVIMKGKRFESIQDVEAATTAQLKTLMKENFQNCFRKWQKLWDKCVQSEGEYFEGDKWQCVFYRNNFFLNIHCIFYHTAYCLYSYQNEIFWFSSIYIYI